MKNLDVLRMAAALLTPEKESSSASTETTDGTVATASVSASAVSTTDPLVAERLRVLLEASVRMLHSKGLLSGEDLPSPEYPLMGGGEFPLPDGLAPVAAYHAAWLLSGETHLRTAYEQGLECYLAALEAVIEPIVESV